MHDGCMMDRFMNAGQYSTPPAAACAKHDSRVPSRVNRIASELHDTDGFAKCEEPVTPHLQNILCILRMQGR